MSSATANSGPQPLRSWTYGADPGCDFVISGAGVSSHHCMLTQYAEGYALEDLSSAQGTWINGRRIAPRQAEWVQPVDRITLGPSTPFQWPGSGSARAGGSSGASTFGTGGRTITVGRAPENDVVLDYPMISWNHARLSQDSGGRLVIEDLGSTNGTAVGSAHNRIQRANLQPDDSIYFGSFKIRVSRLLDGKKVAFGAASQGTVDLRGDETVIGRDPACDYPLEYPIISWHHAKITKTSRGIEIEDLGSRNGTFVDGARISGKVALKTGSEIGLGSFRFRLIDESGRLEKRDYSGNVTIEANDVVVSIKTRRLLDPVSLTVFPSELVALMGLAGAGKTTLMKALNGYTPPSAGRVLFNGEDLYANQEQFRLQVGYVPQDDILHPELTVKEALYYTAKLRTDLRDSEIETRIMQVLKDLGIEDIGNRLIGSPERKVISGGQRKRVNIAMELLSDPSVLFLDEPTSGLSSYDAEVVVQMLRRLADSGKTIVCTIHQPSLDIFKAFDCLMMVARDKGENAGVLAYYGPAYPDSVEFFNPRESSRARADRQPLSPEQLMSGVAARPASEWVRSYIGSETHNEFVKSRSGKIVSTASAGSGKKRRELGFGQMITLFRRNFLLKTRDRMQTSILLGQAPLFAILVAIVFNSLTDQNFTDPAKWAEFGAKLSSTLFLTVVAAVWFGCNNAARDIVGETAIFLRERMVNLKLPSYVFSKVATLGIICLFQCVALLTIVYFLCKLSGSYLTLLGILFAASLVGTSLGLLISAVAPTTESAIAFLPVVLLPFILLGGGIKPLHEMPKAAQWIASICPTRWGYEAALLQEAKERKSTFKNALEEQVLNCQNSVAACQARLGQPASRTGAASPKQVAVQTDVAAAAFPSAEGRSSLRRSFEVLGITLGILLILLLGTLSLKSQR